MKRKSTSHSAFFNLRVLIASVLCLFGVFVALLGSGMFAQTKGTTSQQSARSNANQDAPGTQRPDVSRMVGPVMLTTNLRDLPYIPNKGEYEAERLVRFHPSKRGGPPTQASASPLLDKLMKSLSRPMPNMPGPLLTFEGIGDTCGCQPSDSEGDVGPNHYIEAINLSFKIFDKNGNTLSGPTTYNSFFNHPPLTNTPCANANQGDPYVLYDKQADRWVLSDFAFPQFPGTSFWQCIGVSQSPDPVAGPWALYAIQIDPTNNNQLGDYPKFAIWNDGGTQNAYFFTVNLFINNTTFVGVRVFGLDRTSMLAGNPANAIGFTIPPSALGDGYSLVAANFRTGDPPPTGRDEMLLAIDANFGTFTQVMGWLFHVDFANPANSTLGTGSDHSPNALITVDPFVDAQTNALGTDIIPQQGTAVKLDTLGDKIMTPVVYQNRGGTESLWADGTICQDANCTQPTGIRWYQFDVTGGTFPATPVQQQTWTNAGDGLFRWMPSIAVDESGNTVIGYSTSSTGIFPSIRYAGRLTNDPPSDLGQGEGIMFAGVSAQTTGPRWGDYTRTEVDPSTGMDFWHINQYAQNGDWHTRIGKFNFVGGGTPTPTPTPTATPRGTPTPRPRPTPAPRP
jgi:hypothetical protein